MIMLTQPKKAQQPSRQNITPSKRQPKQLTTRRNRKSIQSKAAAEEVQAQDASQQLNGTPPREEYHMATRLVHAPQPMEDAFGASSPPLYQTATFKQDSATECGPYDYTRSGNPTRDLLENWWAELEGGCSSQAFASGMQALSTLIRLVRPGQHIVAGTDIYGGTSRLLERIAPNLGLEVSNVDQSKPEEVKAVLKPGKTRLLLLESPTNPRMQVIDLKALIEMGHEAGALVAVDNSVLTPLYQKPLELGADISMTSATKFISGHADVTGGMLAAKDREIGDELSFYQNAEGGILGPFDCWLLLRGLKTMELRMERQVSNCQKIAEFLEGEGSFKKVNYPGLKSNAGYELNRRQAMSAGSLLSFETGSVDVSRKIVENCKLFKVTVSFGSVVSLISLPCYMSHASIPAELRAARGLPDDLIRISAGIEHPDDLLKDLGQAIKAALA